MTDVMRKGTFGHLQYAPFKTNRRVITAASLTRRLVLIGTF
jgi:hypothetical protein